MECARLQTRPTSNDGRAIRVLQSCVTCRQVSETSSTSAPSGNTPRCRAFVVDENRDIDHTILKRWLNFVKLTYASRIKMYLSDLPLENATSFCKHDICLSKCGRLRINRNPSALATTHRKSVVNASTRISYSSSEIDPISWLFHKPTSWLIHMTLVDTSNFNDTNPDLSDIRQLHHQATIRSRLSRREFFGARHLYYSIFIFLST